MERTHAEKLMMESDVYLAKETHFQIEHSKFWYSDGGCARTQVSSRTAGGFSKRSTTSGSERVEQRLDEC